MVRVSSDERSMMELGLLGRWTIRPKLMSVPGVANVSMWGHQEQQLQVQVDPERLQAEGVTLDQVISTTGNALWVSHLTFLEASTPGAGGFFETASQRIGVEHSQPIQAPEDLAKIALDGQTAEPGVPLKRLGDVTTIVEDHQPLIGDTAFGDEEGLLIVVEKLPEANVLTVTDDLEEALSVMAPGLQGVTLDASFFGPAEYVNDSMSNLTTAADHRRAADVARRRSPPVRLATVVGGLDLDPHLDVGRRCRAGDPRERASTSWCWPDWCWRSACSSTTPSTASSPSPRVSTEPAVWTAAPTTRSIERRVSAAAPAATTPADVRNGESVRPLPISVLTGETGAFLPSLALSYLGAVVASTIVAITVTPSIAMPLRPSTLGNRTSPGLRATQAQYERPLGRIVGSVRPGLIVAALLLVVGLVALPFIDRGDPVIPELRDETCSSTRRPHPARRCKR